MLPTELLINRSSGETLVPKRLKLDSRTLTLAQQVIERFQSVQGSTQGSLSQQLAELEGDSPDYRILRGFAHLLRNSFCTFEIVSPLDPQDLRERVFALAAQAPSSPEASQRTLSLLADQLSQELDRGVYPEQIQQGLYADLAENRILTQFEAPSPETLIHRYNLSQVQGLFYRASEIVITAHRNDPGEYKLLFRYLKLFQLMTTIEGDADHGFTITVDGPTSLFKPSTRYGLALAKLIPALLHVTKWSLRATLQIKDSYAKQIRTRHYTLDSNCGLVSHYPPGKPFDSMVEEAFADRWSTLKTEWRLEREVDLLPIPGSVMIPDFRLVHPDGRSFLLEIVGYWRPEYLRKKFAQVRKSGCDHLILAISERLNLEKAGVKTDNVPAWITWYKDKLNPRAILEILENSQ